MTEYENKIMKPAISGDLQKLVGHSSSTELLNELLERDDLEEAIPSILPQQLYCLVKNIGMEDCAELLLCASHKQIQTCLDIDVWEHEDFDSLHFGNWLRLLFELPEDRFKVLFKRMESELFSLYLMDSINVFYPDEDGQPPEEVDAKLELSPCNAFYIYYGDDEASAFLAKELIGRIYAMDLLLGQRVLSSLMVELRSQVEFTAWHIKSGRLEEFGFLPFDEAIEIYKQIDPVAVKNSNEPRGPVVLPEDSVQIELPIPYARALIEAPENRFIKLLEKTTAEQLREIKLQLIFLANRYMVVFGVTPENIGAQQNGFNHLLGTLMIGLEYLADSEPDRMAELLTKKSLVLIFRTGASIIDKLGRRAKKMVARKKLTLTDGKASLCTDEEQELLECLLEPLAIYRNELGDPFMTIKEIGEASRSLDIIEYKEGIFFSQINSQTELATMVYQDDLFLGPEQIRFETLMATMIINRFLKLNPILAPIRSNIFRRSIEVLVQATEAAITRGEGLLSSTCRDLVKSSTKGTDSKLGPLEERLIARLLGDIAEGVRATVQGSELQYIDTFILQKNTTLGSNP